MYVDVARPCNYSTCGSVFTILPVYSNLLLCIILIPVPSVTASKSKNGKILIVELKEWHKHTARENQHATVVAISDISKIANNSILKTVCKSLPYSEFYLVWLYVKTGKDNFCVGVLWGFWIKSYEFLFFSFHIIFIFQKSKWRDSQAVWKRCYWLIRMRNSQP